MLAAVSRAAAAGRDPAACAVLNAVSIVIGETEAIAREKSQQLDALADPDLVLAHNSTMIGADLARHRTAEAVAASQGNAGIKGIEEHVIQVAAAEGISYAEAARKPPGVLVGTAKQIADQLQEVWEAGGCDGFIVWPTVSPVMFEEFGRLVVPELQKRGLVQAEYAPGTRRDKLGAEGRRTMPGAPAATARPARSPLRDP